MESEIKTKIENTKNFWKRVLENDQHFDNIDINDLVETLEKTESLINRKENMIKTLKEWAKSGLDITNWHFDGRISWMGVQCIKINKILEKIKEIENTNKFEKTTKTKKE